MQEGMIMEEFERLERLWALADLVSDRVKALLENTEATPQGLKHLTGVLKDIKEVQMLKDPQKQEQDTLMVRLEEALQRLSE